VRYALAAALAGLLVTAGAASAGLADGSGTFSDAVGDSGDAPDVASVTVSDTAGVLVVHATLANRTALQVPDSAGVFLNLDEDALTGACAVEFQCADVLLELHGNGSYWQRRWNGTTFPLEPVPSATYRAEWASGYRFSIALSELGMPRKLTVVVKTLYSPAGTSFPQDLAFGFYNVETGRVEDPFTDVRLPEAPSGVRATRTLRTGVRVTWDPTDYAERYEVWRAKSFNARGGRIWTGESEAFLDRRAVRGVRYFYWVRALNELGAGAASPRVVGKRR
jgi:hypothetical protein